MMGIPVVSASEGDVKTLQDFLDREDPDAILNISLVEGLASFGDISFKVQIQDGRKKSLVEGTWDTMGLLVKNLPATRKKSANLPYLNGFR
jgi:hypothetical protein